LDSNIAPIDAGAATDSAFPRTVAFDRRLIIITLIGAALFIWPLFAHGRAANIQDSPSYYKAGQKAVGFVIDHVPGRSLVSPSTSAKGATAKKDDWTPQQTRGARSVAYSVLAYVLGAPHGQMWLLVVAQAIATGFACAVGLLLFDARIGTSAVKLAILAVATPVAFAVCFLLPDIFAGLLIFLITLLATAYQRLSQGVRTVSVLIATAAIAFHSSHLPIGLGMTGAAGVGLLIAKRRGLSVPTAQWAWLVTPFLIGAAMTVAMNAVAFGGASLTGKRWPLTLARSAAEGPAKWYLDQNCPHLKYAICEVYPHGVPGRVDDFLWGKNSISVRATPAQLDRIRAEESEVVLAATRAYPFQEIGRVSYQTARQIGHFEPYVGLNFRIVDGPDGAPISVEAPFNRGWSNLVGWLSIASVLASLALLIFRWRTLGVIRPMLYLVLLGVLLNAAVCVYFSGISARYGARVIWLIPLLALMALGTAGRRVGEAQVASRG